MYFFFAGNFYGLAIVFDNYFETEHWIWMRIVPLKKLC